MLMNRGFMNYIILILKGMVIGLANVIPGVSGGTLMITLGVYERIISCISHFFKKFKENLKFILPLGIGLVLGILLFSKIIKYSLEHFQFATTLLFIGLILGGMPLLMKKIKGKKKSYVNYIIFIITFSIVTIFTFLQSGNSVVNLDNITLTGGFKLFLIGMVSASSMIIPGISGSFMLMLFGYYQPIISVISSITDFSLLGHNVVILGIFALGILIGIVLVAKLIEYFIKKDETKTYYGVLGFVLASILSIIVNMHGVKTSFIEVIVGIILLALGTYATYKISEK